MAITYSHINHSIFKCSLSHKPSSLSFTGKSSLPIDSFCRRRPQSAIRSSSLNAPLEPNSFHGRSLCDLLHNEPDSFYDAVSLALNRLSDDRCAVIARMIFSAGSPEGCLHWRIAEMKEEEYEHVVKDITYILIRKKFLEIGVPLEHKHLSNGKLEILPSNIKELEAIHSPDVLEVIRQHLTAVIGTKKAGSNVMISRSTAHVETLHLTQVYAASVLYGHFLKSASLRYRLERNFSMSYLDIIPSDRWGFLFGSGFYGVKSVALGEFTTERPAAPSQLEVIPKLKVYMQELERPKVSKAAMDVVEKHCSGLFVDERDEVILTSLDSLKRLILEAVAFGGFLWEAEEFVDRGFKID